MGNSVNLINLGLDNRNKHFAISTKILYWPLCQKKESF